MISNTCGLKKVNTANDVLSGFLSVRHFQSMSEEDLEQMPDALDAYKKQLNSMKEDLEVLILFSNPYLIGQVQQYTTGVPSAIPDVKEKCLRFLERHGSLTR